MGISHIQASLSYAVQYQRQYHAYNPHTGLFILRRSVPTTVSCVYPIHRPLYLTPFSTSDSIMRITHIQASLSYAVQYQRQYHAYIPYTGLSILRRRYTVRFARTEPADCPVHGPIVPCDMSLECPGHVKIGWKGITARSIFEPILLHELCAYPIRAQQTPKRPSPYTITNARRVGCNNAPKCTHPASKYLLICQYGILL